MKNIRNLVERMRHVGSLDGLTPRQFRLIVPLASQFELEQALARSVPITGGPLDETPGVPFQGLQLLEWLDDPSIEINDLQNHATGVDLSAILAMAIGRRVSFAHEASFGPQESNLVAFMPIGDMYDFALFGPAMPDHAERFRRLVNAIVALDDRRAEALGSAMRKRNAACCLIDSDPSLAYAILVIAIETLSREFGNPPTDWESWEQAENWDRFLLDHQIGGAKATAIKVKLIADKPLRLRRTFTAYAMDRLTPRFWDKSYVRYRPHFHIDGENISYKGVVEDGRLPISDFVPEDRDERKKQLDRSYDFRSKVFHEGVIMEPIQLLRVPWPKRALSFAGLRCVLDELIWKEVEESPIADFEIPALPSVE